MTRSQELLKHIAARNRESRTLHELGMPEVGRIYVINDQLEILGEAYTQAPESQGYKVLGTTHETWWRSLQRHRPDLHAHDGDDYPRGRVRYRLSTQHLRWCSIGTSLRIRLTSRRSCRACSFGQGRI
jgi:hypothetical protein